MKFITKTILLIIFSSILANAQKINTKKIDSILTKSNQQHVFNGVILIAKNDSIIFEKSYGYENLEKKTPFSPISRFQVASISKQFTAFGILLLQEQNKLSVHDAVKKHLPQFPFESITIHHLLTHTSGLPNFPKTMIKDLDTSKVNGNAQMLDMLASGKYPMQWQAG